MLKTEEAIKMEFGSCAEYKVYYRSRSIANFDDVYACINTEIIKWIINKERKVKAIDVLIVFLEVKFLTWHL
jgi:hypothetical protein